jgi:hypothetical protein
LRQTEGLTGLIMALLGLGLAVPDHSTPQPPHRALEVPRFQTGNGPAHLPVGSTGLQLCKPGEWLAEKPTAGRRPVA